MKAEGAGVWWASMPLGDRMLHQNFAENQDIIEERWTADFGDKLNELVFIGIKLDENAVRKTLDACISTDKEIMLISGNFPENDSFPIPRQFVDDNCEVVFNGWLFLCGCCLLIFVKVNRIILYKYVVDFK